MKTLTYQDSIDEATEVLYELADLTGQIDGRRFVGFIVPMVVLLLTFTLFRDSVVKMFCGVTLAGVVLAYDLCTYKNRIRRNFRASLQKVRGSDSPVLCEYELDETGMRIRQMGQELKFDWSTVVNVDCPPDRIKIVLKPPGIAAIPTRAFASVEQREEWIKDIRNFTKLNA